MYLEISSRQSGKTTRLVTAVVEWFVECKQKKTPGRAVIVTCNSKQAENIEQLLYIEIAKNTIFPGPKGNFDYVIISGTPAQLTSQVIEYKPVRRFFDEFDFNPNIKNGGKFEDFSDDYYCTTPARIRKITPDILEKEADDLLLRLWIKNGCECASYATLCQDLSNTYQHLECQAKFFNISPSLLLPPKKQEAPVKIVLALKNDTSTDSRVKLIASADIVVSESSGEYFQVIKNRFGTLSEGKKLPLSVLDKFIANPAGSLRVDWE